MNYSKLMHAMLLLLFLHAQLPAQQTARYAGDTHINFIVKDQLTGFAVKGATIQMKTADGRTTPLQAAANGTLRLPAMNGRYSFIISANGYKPLETYFITGADSAIEANINLDPVDDAVALQRPLLQPQAGNITLTGYIRDADENTPLPGVEVSAGKQKAITDNQGFFTLQVVIPIKTLIPGQAPGKITIHAGKAGYVPYTIQNFYAIPDAYNLKIALSSTTSARWQARAQQPVEETETHVHGLFDRTEADDRLRYANPPAAKIEDATALAATVPTSIRVGTSCSCTSCSVVQVMSLESYTQTGLDDEWIASWGAASLQAGAVAYRTYGAWYVLHPVASSYDIAATTCNQAWQNDVSTSTRNAAIATAGTVLIKNGAIFRSEYSAENNNSGCGNGYSGTGSSWPCISDARCAGRAKNGHGRGMCQWGSSFWASDRTYTWILNHYYNPGSVFIQFPTPPPVTTINFTVKDQVSGAALASTSVSVTAPNGSTSTLTTDAGGKLSFGADSGQYRFSFSKSGYKALATSFSGGPNATITADINLDPAAAARIATSSPAAGNSMVVNGYVRDAIHNGALAGAHLQIGSVTATTDANGYFSITLPASPISPNSMPDIFSIRTEKSGYQSHTIQNFFAIPDTYTLQILLQAGGTQNRQTTTTEIHTHGLFNKKNTDDHDQASTARTSEALAAAELPAGIRVATSCDCSTCSGITVQVMSLESYVQSGLDDEWLSSWNAASLQAGAVAYRSRGAWYALHPVAANYDISAAACHQTWQNDRSASVKNAAIATAGIVLVKNGAIVKAEYCAESNNAGCGNGFSGTGTTWPCIADARCAGRTTNGHGRGMCQWGSSFWGADQTYTWILNHYYNPDSTFIQLPGALTNADTDARINSTTLKLSPNPVTGNQVTLTYHITKAQPATITLLDNFGHTVRRQQVNLQAGNNSLNFVTGKLKPGAYMLHVRYNATNKVESTKLMILQ